MLLPFVFHLARSLRDLLSIMYALFPRLWQEPFVLSLFFVYKVRGLLWQLARFSSTQPGVPILICVFEAEYIPTWSLQQSHLESTFIRYQLADCETSINTKRSILPTRRGSLWLWPETSGKCNSSKWSSLCKRTKLIESKKKLDPEYPGPYEVSHQLSTNMFRVKGSSKPYHASQMKKMMVILVFLGLFFRSVWITNFEKQTCLRLFRHKICPACLMEKIESSCGESPSWCSNSIDPDQPVRSHYQTWQYKLNHRHAEGLYHTL